MVAEEEVQLGGKISCNEEEDEEWQQDHNSDSTEEQSPLHAASDNSLSGSIVQDGDVGMITDSINGSTRNGSTTPLDERRLRRQIANCNERRRMQSINAGFQALRSLLPFKDGEKLSKAAILQHTADYIQTLQEVQRRFSDGTSTTTSSKRRRVDPKVEPKTEVMESSIPVIQSQPAVSTVPLADVKDVHRTIENLQTALSKEQRLRILYERELLDMRARNAQEANNLNVFRTAANMHSFLNPQPNLSFDQAALPHTESPTMLISNPPTQTDPILFASHYNNVILNAAAAAAAAATTPPELSGMSSSQISPHHHQTVATNHTANSNNTTSSNSYHQPPAMHHHPHQHCPHPFGDLVMSTPTGLSSPAAATRIIQETNGARTLATFSQPSPPSELRPPVSQPQPAVAAPTAAAPPTSFFNQRNFQAFVDAIRHIEGGHVMAHVAKPSSPTSHSSDLLVR